MKKIILVLLAIGLFNCSSNTGFKDENNLLLPPEYDLVPSQDVKSDIVKPDQSLGTKVSRQDLNQLKEILNN